MAYIFCRYFDILLKAQIIFRYDGIFIIHLIITYNNAPIPEKMYLAGLNSFDSFADK